MNIMAHVNRLRCLLFVCGLLFPVLVGDTESRMDAELDLLCEGKAAGAELSENSESGDGDGSNPGMW